MFDNPHKYPENTLNNSLINAALSTQNLGDELNSRCLHLYERITSLNAKLANAVNLLVGLSPEAPGAGTCKDYPSSTLSWLDHLAEEITLLERTVNRFY